MAASKTYSMTYEMSATGGSNVSAAFGEAQQALVKLQTEIESLNKTQSDISAYEKQQEAVEKSRQKVENYRQQLENLKAAQQLANSSASEAQAAYQRQAEAVEEARKNADELKEQLAALQKEQQESGDSSQEMANRVQDMAQQVDRAEQEVRQQESALSGMNTEQREAGTEALNTANKVLNMQNKLDNAEQSEAKQEAQLNKMGEKLRDAGVDTNDLTGESQRLESEINDLREAELQAGDAAEEFGDKGSQSIDAVATMLASSGIMKGLKEVASAFMDCINTAADFEKEMSNVEALSGATGDELESLTAIAQEMGATTSFTASEAAEGLSYMALAGWDTEAMMEGLEPILNLAAASAMDLGTASDIVTDYLTAFGLSAADAAEFTDQMAYAMSNSNTTTEQLGEAYKSCAASASSMGFSVEDTTAAIMVMSNAGIKGSEAGTALNAVMTRLATDTKGCATALGEYGVAVYDNEGNMNSLSDILTGMAGIWGDLTDAEQASLSKTIAGTSHYAALQTVMDGCSESAAEGGQSFSDYAAALEDCSGTSAKMAETQLDNLSGKMTLLNSATDGLKIAIGSELSGAFGSLVDVATNAVNKLTEFVTNNPAVVDAFTAVVAVVGAATAAVVAYNVAMKIAESFTGGGFMAIAAAAGLAVGAVIGVVSAIKNANDETQNFEEAMENITAAQETLAADQNILDLADQYYKLSEEVQDTSLSDEELAEKEAELQDVRQKLDDATDGRVSAEEDVKEAYDNTLDSVVKVVQAEKEASTAEIYANLVTGAKGYQQELQQLAELEEKQAAASQEAADAMEYMTKVTSAEDLQPLYSMLDDLNAVLYESGSGSVEMTEKLRDMEDAIYEFSGTEVHLNSVSDAQAAVSELAITTEMAAERFTAANDEAKSYDEEIDRLTESTEGFQQQVMDMVELGVMPAAQAADTLGISTEELEQMMFDAAAASEELEEAEDALGEEAEEAAEQLDQLTNYSELSTLEMLKLESAARLVGDGIMTADDAARIYGIDVDDLNTYLEEQDAWLADIQNACALAESGYYNAEQAANLFGVTVEEMDLYQAQQRVDELSTELEELQDAYDKAYQSAYDSIMGQLSLTEKLAQDAERDVVTVQGSIENLTNSAAYIQQYEQALETLNNYHLDADFITQFCDTSSDGMSQAIDLAKDLNSMTTEGAQAAVGELNEAFEGTKDYTDQASNAYADVETDFTNMSKSIQDELSSLEAQVAADVNNIVADMDKSSDAYSNGAKMAQSYANGILSNISAIKSAASQASSAGQITGSSSGSTSEGNATGGFTNGPELAGEDPRYPVEAVISFDPAYREQNIEYLQQAAGMLGVTDVAETPVSGSSPKVERYSVAPWVTEMMAMHGADVIPSGGNGGDSIVVQFEPVYNISGAGANAEEIRVMLQEHDRDLKSEIEDILDDIETDRARRRY